MENLDNDKICLVDGCENARGRYLCRNHLRLAKIGKLDVPKSWGVKLNPVCKVRGCTARSSTKRKSSALVCHVHAIQISKGITPGTTRPKRRGHEEQKECTVKGCSSDRRVKGMCSRHYGQKQAELRPKKTSLCVTEGCSIRTRNQRCSTHTEQFDKWGFCWNGRMPLEKIKKIRESKKSKCLVDDCTKLGGLAFGLCPHHHGDMNRKSLDVSDYLTARLVSECQACGSDKRLVLDHDHSCCAKDRMCRSCIRGKLCSDCNSALGMVGDSLERLEALVEYAKWFEAGGRMFSSP